MDLSPEEYGAYWRASVRIAAAVFLVVFGYRFSGSLLDNPTLGARLMGWFLVGLLLLAGTFLAVLGLARAVRTAVDAERR